jgi:DNA-binding transcriptional ArsR family regulator
MPSHRAKDALFEAIALMGKAFSSPRRLELLDLLAQAPRSVEELARAGEQSSANTSQHLQALHAAGMVTRTRDGNRVRYELAGDHALRLWLALRDASASQLAEVERIGSAAPSCASGWRRATSSWWTSGPPRSSRRGT